MMESMKYGMPRQIRAFLFIFFCLCLVADNNTLYTHTFSGLQVLKPRVYFPRPVLYYTHAHKKYSAHLQVHHANSAHLFQIPAMLLRTAAPVLSYKRQIHLHQFYIYLTIRTKCFFHAFCRSDDQFISCCMTTGIIYTFQTI